MNPVMIILKQFGRVTIYPAGRSEVTYVWDEIGKFARRVK